MDPVTQTALVETAKIAGPAAAILAAFVVMFVKEVIVPGSRLVQARTDWERDKATMQLRIDAQTRELDQQHRRNLRVARAWAQARRHRR